MRYLLVAAAVVLAFPAKAEIVTRETKAGPIKVAAQYAERFVGFINALVESGYKPRAIGCYARSGHMRGSKHYWGGACDIDQKRRNVTAKMMYTVSALAAQYNLKDGCTWKRTPDCGHVEVPGPTSTFSAYSKRRAHYAEGNGSQPQARGGIEGL